MIKIMSLILFSPKYFCKVTKWKLCYNPIAIIITTSSFNKADIVKVKEHLNKSKNDIIKQYKQSHCMWELL